MNTRILLCVCGAFAIVPSDGLSRSFMSGLPVYEVRLPAPARMEASLLRIHDHLVEKCRIDGISEMTISIRPEKEVYLFILATPNVLTSKQRDGLKEKIQNWRNEIAKKLIDEYNEQLTRLMDDASSIDQEIKVERSPERMKLLDHLRARLSKDMKEITESDVACLFDAKLSENETEPNQ